MTPDQVLDRAREIERSNTSQGSERVLAKEVIRLREVLQDLWVAVRRENC